MTQSCIEQSLYQAINLKSGKKYIKTTLNKNSYPSRILCSRKKTKAEITDSPHSNKGYVITPHFPGLSEKIRRSLIPHGVKTIMKPGAKLGQVLSSHKDKTQSNKRQGAIYQIPCKHRNMGCIGKTKRSFETKKKNISEISETLSQNLQISKITPQHFANTPLTCTTILTGTIAKF